MSTQALNLLDIATREYRAVKRVSELDSDLVAFKSVMATAGMSIETEKVYYSKGEISVIARIGEGSPIDDHDAFNFVTKGTEVVGFTVRFKYTVTEWSIPTSEYEGGEIPRLHVTDRQEERVILNTLAAALGTRLVECTVENNSRNATGHKHYAILESMPKWRLQLHFSDYEDVD